MQSDNDLSAPKSFDVVIVGAGMVGATLACGLAQHHVSVALIDRQLPKPFDPEESPRIRVSALNLASEQLLRNIGAWKYITEQRVLAYEYLSVNDAKQQSGLVGRFPDISAWATTRFEASELGRSHLGHIIENDVIQNGLLNRACDIPGIELFTDHQVESIEHPDEGSSLRLSDGRTLQARLVIGADGAQSQVRKLAEIGQYAERYEQQAMVISVRYSGPLQTGTWQMFRPEGPVAFLPLASVNDQHFASLVWYDSPEKIAELKQLSDPQLKQAIEAVFPDNLPQIAELKQSASFPLVKSHAQKYWSEGVILVGDAAHTINPLAGQGVNLGLMDAAVLIEKLATAKIEDRAFSDPAIAREYEAARRKYNQIMMSAMDLFYAGFSNEIGPLHVARNLGLGLAQRSGPIKKRVVEFATGLVGDVPRLAQVDD